MTTIAYRDGILACDSCESDDKGYVLTLRAEKIYRFYVPGLGERKYGMGECLFGGAGDSESIERLVRAVKANEAIELEDTEALLIEPDDSYWLYEGALWIKGKLPYYALGTGAPYATAAFRAGCDAIRAAEIGRDMDPGSGGPIQVLTTDRHKSNQPA
jgi:hypothetical protein